MKNLYNQDCAFDLSGFHTSIIRLVDLEEIYVESLLELNHLLESSYECHKLLRLILFPFTDSLSDVAYFPWRAS